MCGIAGYFGKTKIQFNKQKILNSLKHRGPTNQSIYQKINKKNNIFFAFSRLAIIDLDSRSNQPYIYKNLTLCFNGEIYNYKIIKNELLKKGITFETSSDTEVLAITTISSLIRLTDTLRQHANEAPLCPDSSVSLSSIFV